MFKYVLVTTLIPRPSYTPRKDCILSQWKVFTLEFPCEPVQCLPRAYLLASSVLCNSDASAFGLALQFSHAQM